MKLSKLIKEGRLNHQSLGLLIGQYHICESCRIVDKDAGRIEYGHLCSRCRQPGRGGHLYYDFPILSVMDLIKDFYDAGLREIQQPGMQEEPELKYSLAVIIFYCTLAETLMYKFLLECMLYQNISRKERDGLMKDNLSMRLKRDRLFPALTGDKWGKALNKLDMDGSKGYREVARYLRDVNEKRNLVLHEGNKWSVPKDMPTRCVDSMEILLRLFVDLHNKYIAESFAS